MPELCWLGKRRTKNCTLYLKLFQLITKKESLLSLESKNTSGIQCLPERNQFYIYSTSTSRSEMLNCPNWHFFSGKRWFWFRSLLQTWRKCESLVCFGDSFHQGEALGVHWAHLCGTDELMGKLPSYFLC